MRQMKHYGIHTTREPKSGLQRVLLRRNFIILRDCVLIEISREVSLSARRVPVSLINIIRHAQQEAIIQKITLVDVQVPST